MVNYYSFYLSLSILKEPTYSSLYSIPPEIQKLVHKLALFENVERVRAVIPRAIDFHQVEFELKFQPEIALRTELWDKVQDLVIQSEWSLRDRTGESWYFDVRIANTFSKVKDGAEIAAASYM